MVLLSSYFEKGEVLHCKLHVCLYFRWYEHIQRRHHSHAGHDLDAYPEVPDENER